MSDLAELSSRRHVPDVVSHIDRLPEVPMGQVQTVANWDTWLTNATYFPYELNVNDWLLAISVGLDDVDAYTIVEGVTLPNVSNQLGNGVSVTRVSEVTGACILRPSARLRLYIFVYRGLGFSEAPPIYRESFTWNGAQNFLSANQDEIFYDAAAALQGSSAKVANITLGNAKPEYLLYNYSPYVPNHWWTDDIYSTGNPAIDPDKRVSIAFFSGDRPSPIPDTTAYANMSPAYDSAWGTAEYLTVIFATMQVPLLGDDGINSAPIGMAHQPIFTRPDD